ncbi:helix-turn-helix transcriptional regulator [Acidovorax kalamii]|uniref:helix-turn-helix transcriptional regulator n=1 Tax=Acidovorax kalamii TaxID=2004485 RepID=UPI003B8341FE
MSPLLSAAQVSQYLGISKRSLETLLSRGDGPRFLWVGCQRRWAQSELTEWTRTRIVNSKKESQSTLN